MVTNLSSEAEEVCFIHFPLILLNVYPARSEAEESSVLPSESKNLQSKADPLIEVKETGRVRVVSEVQPLNAKSEIDVTVSGTSYDESDLLEGYIIRAVLSLLNNTPTHEL